MILALAHPMDRAWLQVTTIADGLGKHMSNVYTVRLQPKSDGLHPRSDGLQPSSDGLQPSSDGKRSTLLLCFSLGSEVLLPVCVSKASNLRYVIAGYRFIGFIGYALAMNRRTISRGSHSGFPNSMESCHPHMSGGIYIFSAKLKHTMTLSITSGPYLD